MLAQLEQAIRESWSLDTAEEEDEGWTPENPSRGQCDVTTLVVHDLLDGERIEAHMWVPSERVRAALGLAADLSPV